MGRKAMDPEVRRQQFIKAAEELFRAKGYDKVTMSEIADRVGVSHGAYFYYYKSKEELMRAVLANSVMENRRYLEALASAGEKTALEKMRTLLSLTISAFSTEHEFMDFAYGYGNADIFREYTLMSREANVPLLVEIIKQGNREGSFHVRYPEDTMKYLLFVFENLYDVIGSARDDRKIYARKMRALEILTARVLGIGENAFKLTD
ncbi:MAG TPA: TetR/AcrR family transcriptional regulator [Methanocella sp.]|nr:TetR/AcrR family transcriptional regulator [Methanocella sp.]